MYIHTAVDHVKCMLLVLFCICAPCNKCLLQCGATFGSQCTQASGRPWGVTPSQGNPGGSDGQDFVVQGTRGHQIQHAACHGYFSRLTHHFLRARSTGLDGEQQHSVVQGLTQGQGAFDPEKVGSGWHVSVVNVVIARSSHCATVNVQHSLESGPFCYSDFIRTFSNKIILCKSWTGSANSW
jgi:hypothetical protein